MTTNSKSSPHSSGQNSVTSIMMWVIVLTLPGLFTLIFFYGWGYLINSVIAIVTALASEAFVLALRKRRIYSTLKDSSAILTGILIGIALPPFAPWWIIVIATAFAIIFVKHLYGGLGQNLFNPAMAAFALVLISFPLPMTTSWAAPAGTLNTQILSFSEQLKNNFEIEIADGYTMATPLDHYKTRIKLLTEEELLDTSEFVKGPLYGIFWVNLAFLIGGILLVLKKIITWHTPVGVITGIGLLAIPFSADAGQAVPISMHLFAGATMIGAFFIATDPATCATSNRGKFIFGLGVGLLTYIIRAWGNFPEAIAFSILLMNFAAPFIDFYTRPKTYGKSKSVSGYKLPESGQ